MILSRISGFFQDLVHNPVPTLISLVLSAFCILLSLIIHECAHGYIALKCGDPTAKLAGRLTLDPRKHLDPIGTICMILLHVGWAKPVPVNPRNFRHYRRDYILVSLAGILANFILCAVSLFLYMMLFKSFLKNGTIGNGSFRYYLLIFLNTLAQMNLGLAVFNVLPVPPLDGFRFLDMFIFKGNLNLTHQTEQVIRLVFLLLCFSGLLNGLLTTAIRTVYNWLAQLFSLIL